MKLMFKCLRCGELLKSCSVCLDCQLTARNEEIERLQWDYLTNNFSE